MNNAGYSYAYPRPMVTVDAILFRPGAQGEEVLLIERKHPPFQGCWALPGGFVEMEESLDSAVARELAEETGIRGVSLEQCYTFGEPDRDPRGRSISVAYVGFAGRDAVACAGDDAAEAGWFLVDDLPALAFDHAAILKYAIRWRANRRGAAS